MTRRFRLAVVLACSIALAHVALVADSNMGLKLVKPIVFAGPGQIGSMWTSIPFFDPYMTAATLCSKLGLTSTGLLRATVARLDPVTGAYTTVTCGTASANYLAIVPGLGVMIRHANVAGAPTSMTIVGSHNNDLQITVPDAGEGNIGAYWYSLPYHATAMTVSQLCAESGLTTTGLHRAIITRVNPVTGQTTSVACGTSVAITTPLVIGEAFKIQEPKGPKIFLPSHF